jgi:PIN domain nuclease of toxin-antitoxin system
MGFATNGGGKRRLTEFVLDASALLALVNNEPGADVVRPLLARSVISSVNLCETVYRLRKEQMSLEEIRLALSPLIPEAIPFDDSLAYVAASIHDQTRGQGLSLGDCACLALALTRGVPAVTTEGDWEKCDVGVKLVKIR